VSYDLTNAGVPGVKSITRVLTSTHGRTLNQSRVEVCRSMLIYINLGVVTNVA